jgi:TldD protein
VSLPLWLLLSALAAEPAPSPVETLLVDELDRAMAALADADERPHYVALTITDEEQVTLAATLGTVDVQRHDVDRYLDIDMRVGTADLDSTHPLRGFSAMDGDDRSPLQVPLGEGEALRHAVWRELDGRYRDGAERIVLLRANRNVKVEEEDPAPDFQPLEHGAVSRAEVPPLTVNEEAWLPHLVAASARIEEASYVVSGSIRLVGDRQVTTMVDTEGARLAHGRRHYRLSMQLRGVADNGDDVDVFRSLDVHDPERLPDPAETLAWADEALTELKARLEAPRADPYSGPVILSGRAAGVFFHEVMGHRVEGHRQKRDTEGKTFADSVGKPVLPAWIDVVDDPTLAESAGHQLNGHYRYDDEGIAAAPAVLVDDGLFQGFLMSRSPIPGFEASNGHGRRSQGRSPVARMGNTMVRAEKLLSDDELRGLLRKELKEQGLEYGYMVDEIDGGFTMTGRVMPNAFNVRAANTWRIYADGRPDERVRGLDLVGTPFVAFGNLLAAGGEYQVFNGVCGAESGWVPVSAVAPSLLFSTLEFQLKEKGDDRPPLIPRPVLKRGGDTSTRDPEVHDGLALGGAAEEVAR